jgi:hypothetical protein
MIVLALESGVQGWKLFGRSTASDCKSCIAFNSLCMLGKKACEKESNTASAFISKAKRYCEEAVPLVFLARQC